MTVYVYGANGERVAVSADGEWQLREKFEQFSGHRAIPPLGKKPLPFSGLDEQEVLSQVEFDP